MVGIGHVDSGGWVDQFMLVCYIHNILLMASNSCYQKHVVDRLTHYPFYPPVMKHGNGKYLKSRF